MIIKFKIFESAEERTSDAFTKWYKEFLISELQFQD